MVTYSYDHIHIRSREPIETARYFNKMFGAEILESVQTDGHPRVDIDINGLMVFIAQAEASTPDGPVDPYVGLDHFGLRVEDLNAAAADLKAKGAEFSMDPKDLRPGLRIAFVRAPGDVRIELLERSG
ncbi:MAG: glyoxalase [Chloroflexi bacterium]|nr:glyoxalase [Chloroflexota bacterium]